MTHDAELDPTSRRIMAALDEEPRATLGWLAAKLRLARGTVQGRVAALFAPGVLRPPSTLVRTASVGLPMRAIVTANVDQDQFETTMHGLRGIPEVLECVATSGVNDLWVQVAVRDSDHLYEVGQSILRTPGVRRTATSIVLRELIAYRTSQLL